MASVLRRISVSLLVLIAIGMAFSLKPSALAEVMIHEIMYHPPSEESGSEPTQLEFIELFNHSTAPVSVKDWAFANGIRLTLPDVALPASGFGILAADPEAFIAFYGDPGVPVMGPWEGKLSNSGERLQLIDAAGEVVDEVHYADEGDWAERRQVMNQGELGWVWMASHDGEGHSLELRSPKAPNDFGQNWGASTELKGSPGRVNTIHEEDIPPLISGVRHDPPVPNASDAVRITTTITDPSLEATSVTLHYRVSEIRPGQFKELPMRDDGMSGDLAIGDGVYGAEIAPHAVGTVIEFYVRASNEKGDRTWPSASDDEGAQEANALLRFDDEPPHPNQATYQLVLPIAEDEVFTYEGQFNGSSNAEMNATFIAQVGGKTEIRYRSSVRLRGNSSRGRRPRGFRVSIPVDQPWQDRTDLNLNGQLSYLQSLSMHLLKASHLPAPDVRNVQVRINGLNETASSSNVHYGSYVHIDPLDNEFLQRTFSDDAGGNLYSKRMGFNGHINNWWGRNGETLVYKFPDWYDDYGWSKESNVAENDWSDLQAFIVAINETPDENYLEDIAEYVNVDQWIRWFAVHNLINYAETGLSNGFDDDYSIYIGEHDKRVVLLSHDMDTTFGMGDTPTSADASIFQMLDSTFPRVNPPFPQHVRFFEHPVIRAAYLREVKELLQTVFHPAQFDPLVDHAIGHVDAEARDAIKQFMRDRRDYVLGLIQQDLQVTSDYPLLHGYPHVESSTAQLSGVSAILDATSISVQGLVADFIIKDGAWQIDDIPLYPGINRIVIESRNHRGEIVDTAEIDLWRDTGSVNEISGELTADRTLLASEGPYLVTEDLIVNAGVTLTIAPGSSLFFRPDAQLKVMGTLIAEGEPYARIRFTSEPTSGLVADLPGLPEGLPKWKGIHWANSASQENRLAYVDIEHAQSTEGSVGAVESMIRLEHVTFAHSHRHLIVVDRSNLEVISCRFPQIFTEDQDPEVLGLANHADQILSIAYPASGEMKIQDSRFGFQQGRNAHVRFVGAASDTVQVMIRDNFFEGNEAIGVAVENADSHIGGNRFYSASGIDGTSATAVHLTAGESWIVRNVFDGFDRALTLEGDPRIVIEKNTLQALHPNRPGMVHSVVHVVSGADPSVYLGHNLLSAVHSLFSGHAQWSPTESSLQLEYNLFPVALAEMMVGNKPVSQWSVSSVFADEAGLQNPGEGDFKLLVGSPASAGGRGGQPIGATSENLWLSSHIPTTTASSSANFTMSGPGLSAFQYRIDWGEWSDVLSVDNGFDPTGTSREAAFAIENLVIGQHLVEVRGQDAVGQWQDGSTVYEWSVSESASALRINEILASNTAYSSEGTFPDLIELYNSGGETISLQGYTLSDDPTEPERYQFPEGATLGAGEFLVLSATSETLGFALSKHGESLSLYHHGEIADEVIFGPQLDDYSLARTPDADWRLGDPTFGESNQYAATGDVKKLRINEWYAANDFRFSAEFVELVNPSALPAALESISLSDDPLNAPFQYRFPENSFIAGQGFVVLSSDPSELPDGGVKIDFRLNASFEFLTLSDEGEQLDSVFLSSENISFSSGRIPDGADAIQRLSIPTPGSSNLILNSTETVPLVNWDAIWKYHDKVESVSNGWRQLDFNDASWKFGPGMLGSSDAPVSPPIRTSLPVEPPFTHYFRHQWIVDSIEDLVHLNFEVAHDDGVVVYLNGQEVVRRGMPEGEINHLTRASHKLDEFAMVGPILGPPNLLVQGQNVLSASVHQHREIGGEVLFGLRMTAVTSRYDEAAIQRMAGLVENLRITELMYYHSSDNPAVEWIEVTNRGRIPLAIGGVRFTKGIEFVFPEMTLEAGERVLVVADRVAFENLYGDGFPIAGEYVGRLDNTGETVVMALPEPYDAAIARVDYKPDLYPTASGAGASLVLHESSKDYVGFYDGWRTGFAEGGTPGTSEVVMSSDHYIENIVNEPLLYQITTTRPVEHFEAKGLPEGLTLESSSGVVSGVPRKSGEFNVRLTGSGSSGSFSSLIQVKILPWGPVDHFEWSSIASPQAVGTHINATLMAKDRRGVLVEDYQGQPSLLGRIISEQPANLRITEVRNRSPWFVEIQNLDDEPIDTSGYKLLLNNGFQSVDAIHGLPWVYGNMWSFPDQMEPDEIIVINADQPLMNFKVGWSTDVHSRGWVAIASEETVVDLVVWGYPSSETRHASVYHSAGDMPFENFWIGDGVDYQGEGDLSIHRTGSVDTDRAEGWVLAGSSPGEDHPALNTPMHFEETVRVTWYPELTFTEGVWSGELDVHDEHTAFHVVANDDWTVPSYSEPFSVITRGRLAMTSPEDVIVVMGEEVQYQIAITPGYRILDVRVSALPPGISYDPETMIFSGKLFELGLYFPEIAIVTDGGILQPRLHFSPATDEDGDGMHDGWEIDNGLDYMDPEDATSDYDGDGVTARLERIAGTDPRDPLSVLTIQSIQWNDEGNLEIGWPSLFRKRYRIWIGTEIDGGIEWELLPIPRINAMDSPTVVTISPEMMTTTRRQFFRVEALYHGGEP